MGVVASPTQSDGDGKSDCTPSSPRSPSPQDEGDAPHDPRAQPGRSRNMLATPPAKGAMFSPGSHRAAPLASHIQARVSSRVGRNPTEASPSREPSRDPRRRPESLEHESPAVTLQRRPRVSLTRGTPQPPDVSLTPRKGRLSVANAALTMIRNQVQESPSQQPTTRVELKRAVRARKEREVDAPAQGASSEEEAESDGRPDAAAASSKERKVKRRRR